MATTPSSITMPVAKPAMPVQPSAEQFAAVAAGPRIYCGQFPPSVSLMTEQGQPVYFYHGFHVTEDPDVVEFLDRQKMVKDVTKEMKLSEVPQAPKRQQGRSWHGADSPTEITPAELLMRVVGSIGSSAQSGGNTQQSTS